METASLTISNGYVRKSIPWIKTSTGKTGKMIIELRGINFVNKGGELMLLAILSKLKEEIPAALVAMEQTVDAPRHRHLAYGIYTKSNFKILGIPFKYFFNSIPSIIRRRWRYINDSEVDVVLDASGFAFGDSWGVKKASKRLGDHVGKWKRQHKKIILLPQAFGPFSADGLVAVMKTIVRYADLVFARDKTSLTYLEQLSGSNKKFLLAPDFTNLVKGTVPVHFNNSNCEVAIIVNNKMTGISSDEGGQAYINLLYRIIGITRNLGHKPFFLLHAGKEDTNIVTEINNLLPDKLPVIKEDNPLYLKGIIGKSNAVITARFHALVSSLSQGVPCLAIGWSHKYEMLLKDYGYPEGMLNVNGTDEYLLAKMEAILSGSSRYIVIEKLKYQIAKQKQRSEEMWKTVFEEMGYQNIENSYSLNPVAAIPSNSFT